MSNLINGTSYQGEFCFPYSWLIDFFGEPNGESDGYKTDVEWWFECNGIVATIYNWKDGPNYTGSGRIEDLTEWHIGGHDKRAIELIRALMKGEHDYNGSDDWNYDTPEPDVVYWRSADLSE